MDACLEHALGPRRWQSVGERGDGVPERLLSGGIWCRIESRIGTESRKGCVPQRFNFL